MTDTFYCGSCGRHKLNSLLSRKTESGRKVCATCDYNRELREAKREAPGFLYPNGTGLDDEKHAKKRAAKKYRDGRLPKFMYS